MPEAAFAWFKHEVELLESTARTGAPTRDSKSDFFGMPADEFREVLRALRDEVEQRAYLAIVAATEACLQLDFRARAKGAKSVMHRDLAKKLLKRETERPDDRIVIEDVLDAWASQDAKKAVSEYKQLLKHRHWLAHGRYFPNHSGVPQDPSFAHARVTALMKKLQTLDPSFPRTELGARVPAR